jgi:hypothetical protein
MRNLIKVVVVSYVSGIACRAGMQLWDSVLSKKTIDFATKLKTAFKKDVN